jgi:hypothetical protein
MPAVVLAAALAAGAAEAQRYDCRFASGQARTGGWISQVLVLDHKAGAASALVNDAIINTFVGVPVQAQVVAETRARTTFAWDVQTATRGSAGAQRAVMRYRLTLYKDGRPATITAQPRGYDNAFSGEGRCRRAG